MFYIAVLLYLLVCFEVVARQIRVWEEVVFDFSDQVEGKGIADDMIGV